MRKTIMAVLLLSVVACGGGAELSASSTPGTPHDLEESTSALSYGCSLATYIYRGGPDGHVAIGGVKCPNDHHLQAEVCLQHWNGRWVTDRCSTYPVGGYAWGTWDYADINFLAPQTPTTFRTWAWVYAGGSTQTGVSGNYVIGGIYD